MLIDYLPETVEIEGVEYEIESNFRTYILFEMLMQGSELSDSEKAMQGLKLAYPVIPDNLEAAVDKLLWQEVEREESWFSRRSFRSSEDLFF